MGVLTVFLDKVTNLMDEHWIGKSDPYVMFELKKDGFLWDKNYGEMKSSKKGGQLNPVYDEMFVFDDVPNLNNVELNIKVLDDDGILYDDKMGKVTISLDELGLSEYPTEVDRVVKDFLFHKDSRIYLRIAYAP